MLRWGKEYFSWKDLGKKWYRTRRGHKTSQKATTLVGLKYRVLTREEKGERGWKGKQKDVDEGL